MSRLEEADDAFEQSYYTGDVQLVPRLDKQKKTIYVLPAGKDSVQHQYAGLMAVTVNVFNSKHTELRNGDKRYRTGPVELVEADGRDIQRLPHGGSNACQINAAYAAFFMNRDIAAVDVMRDKYRNIGYMTYKPPDENFLTPSPADIMNHAHQQAAGKSTIAAYGWEAALNHWEEVRGIILLSAYAERTTHYVYAHRVSRDSDEYIIIDGFRRVGPPVDIAQYREYVIYAFVMPASVMPGIKPPLTSRMNSPEANAVADLMRPKKPLPQAKPKTQRQTMLGADSANSLAVVSSVDSILDQVTPSNVLYREYVQFVQKNSPKNILVLAGTGEGKSRIALREAVLAALKNNKDSQWTKPEGHSICVIAAPYVVIAQQFFDKLCRMRVPYKDGSRIILSKLLTGSNKEGNTATLFWKKSAQIAISGGGAIIPGAGANKLYAEVFVGTFEMVRTLLSDTDIAKVCITCVYDEVQHSFYVRDQRFPAAMGTLADMQKKALQGNKGVRMVYLSGSANFYENTDDAMVRNILKDPQVLRAEPFPAIMPFFVEKSRQCMLKNAISYLFDDNSELRHVIAMQPNYNEQDGVWEFKGDFRAVESLFNTIRREFTPFYMMGMTLVQRQNGVLENASMLALINSIEWGYKADTVALVCAHIITMYYMFPPLTITSVKALNEGVFPMMPAEPKFASTYSKALGSDRQSELAKMQVGDGTGWLRIVVKKVKGKDKDADGNETLRTQMETLVLQNFEDGRRYFVQAGCWNSNALTDGEDELESAFQAQKWMPPVIIATQKIAVGADFPFLDRVAVLSYPMGKTGAKAMYQRDLIEQAVGRVDRSRTGRAIYVEEGIERGAGSSTFVTSENYKMMGEFIAAYEDSDVLEMLSLKQPIVLKDARIKKMMYSPPFGSRGPPLIAVLVATGILNEQRVARNALEVFKTYAPLRMKYAEEDVLAIMEAREIRRKMQSLSDIQTSIRALTTGTNVDLAYFMPYGHVVDAEKNRETVLGLSVVIPDDLLKEIDGVLAVAAQRPRSEEDEEIVYEDNTYNALSQLAEHTLSRGKAMAADIVSGAYKVADYARVLAELTRGLSIEEKIWLFAYITAASGIAEESTDMTSADQNSERQAARTRDIDQHRVAISAKIRTALMDVILRLIVPNTVFAPGIKEGGAVWTIAVEMPAAKWHQEHAWTLMDTMSRTSVRRFWQIRRTSKKSVDDDYKLLRFTELVETFSRMEDRTAKEQSDVQFIMASSPVVAVLSALAKDIETKFLSLLPGMCVSDFSKSVLEKRPELTEEALKRFFKNIKQFLIAKGKPDADPASVSPYQKYKYFLLSDLFMFAE